MSSAVDREGEGEAPALSEAVGAVCRLVIALRAVALLVTVLYIPQQDEVPLLTVALVAAAIASYLPLRHWDTVGPMLTRHPSYLAAELFVSVAILAMAGPESPFFYFTLGTAFLAGLIYRWPGAVLFSALLLISYFWIVDLRQSVDPAGTEFQRVVGLPALYPLAAIAGVAVRDLLLRRARAESALAAAQASMAVERERSRLAREMHDSLAKTVEGVSLQALAVARQIEAPRGARSSAEALARDAREASAEARSLMQYWREKAPEQAMPFPGAVEEFVAEWARGSGVDVRSRVRPGRPIQAVARGELWQILGEALDNVERHARADLVTVEAGVQGDSAYLRVVDDGVGFDPDSVLESSANGHFGLLGLRERAKEVGGTVEILSAPGAGTSVLVSIPVAGATSAGGTT